MKRVDLLVALKATKGKGEKVQLPIGPILIMLAALGGVAYYALVMVRGTQELIVSNNAKMNERMAAVQTLNSDIKVLKQVSPFFEKQAASIKAEIKKIEEINAAELSKSQGLPLRLFTSKLEKVLIEMCHPNEDGSMPEKNQQQLVAYERKGDNIIITGFSSDYDFPARLAKRLAAMKDDTYRQDPTWVVTAVKPMTPEKFSNEKIQKAIEQFKEPVRPRSKKSAAADGAETKAPDDQKAEDIKKTDKPVEKGSTDKQPVEVKPDEDAKPSDTEKEPSDKSAVKKDAGLMEANADHAIAEETAGGLVPVSGPAFRVGSVKRLETTSVNRKGVIVYEFKIVMEAWEVK